MPLMTRTTKGLWNGSAISSSIARQGRRQYWSSRRDLWDPFTEMSRSMDRVFREWDRLLPFRSHSPWDGVFRFVPIESAADGKRVYKIELNLPDFTPEHINVSIKDRDVTVRAKHESDTNGCKQYREYTYQYTLPNEVDVQQVRSLISPEGLLTIEAPLPALKEPELKEIPIEKENKEEIKSK